MNMKKRVLIFLMALAMLATLAACGGGGKSPAGTYKLTQINSGGEEMSVKDLADLFGMEIDMTLELKDDKSFTWDMGLWGEGESASGTWKMDGDSLVLSAEGEDLPVTYDGKTIAMISTCVPGEPTGTTCTKKICLTTITTGICP